MGIGVRSGVEAKFDIPAAKNSLNTIETFN